MSDEWGDHTDLKRPAMLEAAVDFQAGRVQVYLGFTGSVRESI